ncbi:MAG: glycosyltransferase family 2 protein [Candidatus Brocadiae bacterium]|nr:glycosyltransferase family 2 protein [Candidatus Brocadiia bacterium]
MLSQADFPIIVVVATRNRPELLDSRCLSTILHQSFCAFRVIIVDDSDSQYFESNQKIIGVYQEAGLIIEYLQNSCHSGLAHSWNRAIQYANNLMPDCWIAIHDDDDTWHEKHLQLCVEAAKLRNATSVVSGLTVIKDEEKFDQPLLATLHISDFLRGNPGWQGSNTFIMARHLLTIGGYDENMPSTLDRDMAIRLLQQPDIKWAFTGFHTVQYYIESQRKALSSKGTQEKLTGLRIFYTKYAQMMDKQDQEIFFDRCSRFFGINPEWITERKD